MQVLHAGLRRADANRLASVLFDGRLESATIMQGWGAQRARWVQGRSSGVKQSAPEGGGYNAMSVVQLTLLKVRAAAQEDLSQGSQLHTHSYTYLIEI